LNGTKLRRAWEDLPLLLNLPLLAAVLEGRCRFKFRCKSEIPNELFCPKYSLTSCHSGQGPPLPSSTGASSSTVHEIPLEVLREFAGRFEIADGTGKLEQLGVPDPRKFGEVYLEPVR